jgi:hypothetical protein
LHEVLPGSKLEKLDIGLVDVCEKTQDDPENMQQIEKELLRNVRKLKRQGFNCWKINFGLECRIPLGRIGICKKLGGHVPKLV